MKRGIRMTWLLSHRYFRYDNQNELKTMKKPINKSRAPAQRPCWKQGT